jgi:replicative DNA helicase
MLGFGLQPEFMIMSGRPGQGKTSISLQWGLSGIKQDKVVAIFSLEMNAPQITNRIMSMSTGIDSQRLKIGKLTAEEWVIYENTATVLSTMKNELHIFCEPSASPQTIRAKCLQLKAVGQLDLVVIDYLLRVKGYQSLEEHNRVNALTTDLFALKMELDCAFIVNHHLSRAIEHRGDGEPVLSDLTEGGERDPDIVATLHGDRDVIKTGVLIPMKLTFTKQRDGPIGSVPLLFNGSCTTFQAAIPRIISLGRKLP